MWELGNTVETVVLLSKLNTKKARLPMMRLRSMCWKSMVRRHVKRKCGLEVGQNYNLSKKEDAKVPQCPPEKEVAIMEALLHFGMS